MKADFQRYTTRARLRDGTRAVLRPVQPEDKAALQEGLERLSRESVRMRFFHSKNALSEDELRLYTEIDYATHMCLIAELEDGTPLGLGRYVINEPVAQPLTAEVAFTVADEWHGHGVASLILGHLVAIATTHGIDFFSATFLPENDGMHRVFRDSGFDYQEAIHDGRIHGLLELRPPEPESD